MGPLEDAAIILGVVVLMILLTLIYGLIFLGI